MPRVANGTRGSAYLAARNLCCSLLRRYLGRPICVSFCSTPTLRGSETDGQLQTIENEIPRMRKEVTLTQNIAARARGLARLLPGNRCLAAPCDSSDKVSQ